MLMAVCRGRARVLTAETTAASRCSIGRTPFAPNKNIDVNTNTTHLGRWMNEGQSTAVEKTSACRARWVAETR